MNDYQGVGYRCFKTGCDAFTIGIFWYRIRKEGGGMKMDLQKESFISKRADDEKKRNNEIANVSTLSCSNPLLWLIGKYFFFSSLLCTRISEVGNDWSKKRIIRFDSSSLPSRSTFLRYCPRSRIYYQDLFSIKDVSFALAGRLKFLCRFARRGVATIFKGKSSRRRWREG